MGANWNMPKRSQRIIRFKPTKLYDRTGDEVKSRRDREDSDLGWVFHFPLFGLVHLLSLAQLAKAVKAKVHGIVVSLPPLKL